MIFSMDKKKKDIDERERKAWAEVEKRTRFLAEVFGRADVETVKMAENRLSEALGKHLPLYEERTKAKLIC